MTYYVDFSGGLDTNGGTTPETAWKTITKINSVTFSAGDNILFKRGETWTGIMLRPSNAGTALNPIVYDAYGEGALPIIVGLTSANEHALLANAKSYFIVQNLDLRGGDANGAITLMGVSNTPVIRNCKISNDLGTAVYITTGGVTNAQIYNNDITTTAANVRGVYINTADFTTIKDNVIKNSNADKSGATSIGVYIIGASNNSVVSGNTIGTNIDDSYNHGIWIETATALSITLNTIVTGGTTSKGVYATSTAHTISQNTITNVQPTKTSTSLNGIHVKAASSIICGNTIGTLATDSFFNGIVVENANAIEIYENIILYCWNRLEYPDMSGCGITLTGSSAACKIYRNRLIESQIQDVTSSGNGGNEYYHNIVINAHVNGINFCGASTVNPSLIYNNTVIHHPSNGNGHGIVIQTSGKKVKIKNNIIYADISGNNIQCVCINGPYTAVDINNNLYAAINGAYIGKLGTTEYSTLTTWRAALALDAAITGYDNNSTGGDPSFFNMANGSYWLKSNSAAINRGTNLGVAYKSGLGRTSVWPSDVVTIDQDSRGAWDMGGYVYAENQKGRKALRTRNYRSIR